MEKFEGGELVAQFPPQGCGPSPPPEVAVAGGAAHIDVDDIGGAVEGGCPAHDVIHPKCLRLVRCLLQLMVGNGEGLVVGEGVGCGVGARGQAGELRHSLLGHCQKRMRRKALRAVRKRNSGNEGKFVRNSYEFRTNFVRISHSVNL